MRNRGRFLFPVIRLVLNTYSLACLITLNLRLAVDRLQFVIQPAPIPLFPPTLRRFRDRPKV